MKQRWKSPRVVRRITGMGKARHRTKSTGSSLRLARDLLELHRAEELQGCWKAICQTILPLIPNHSVSLYLNYFDINGAFDALHRQSGPGTLQPWKERRKVSPTPEYLRQHPGKRIFGTNDLMAVAGHWEQSPYFRNVMAVEGWNSLKCLTYWNNSNPVAMVVVRKGNGQHDFTSDEAELLEELYGHFETALRRVRHVQEERTVQRALAESLQDSKSGILVLDAAMSPVFRNREILEACLKWNYGPAAARTYGSKKAFAIPAEVIETCEALAAGTVAGPAILMKPNLPTLKISLLSALESNLTSPQFLIHSRPAAGATAPSCQLNQLTPREREVALAVADGSSNLEIAQALGKTEFTVKAQLLSIFRKLQIRRRSQLAALLKQ